MKHAFLPVLWCLDCLSCVVICCVAHRCVNLTMVLGMECYLFSGPHRGTAAGPCSVSFPALAFRVEGLHRPGFLRFGLLTATSQICPLDGSRPQVNFSVFLTSDALKAICLALMASYGHKSILPIGRLTISSQVIWTLLTVARQLFAS